MECTDDNPLETSNLVFFGTQCPSGKATAIVVKIGDATVMGKISALSTSLDTEQTPINKEIELFVKVSLLVMPSLCLCPSLCPPLCLSVYQ